jgi:hypothetical protein
MHPDIRKIGSLYKVSLRTYDDEYYDYNYITYSIE